MLSYDKNGNVKGSTHNRKFTTTKDNYSNHQKNKRKGKK